MREIKRQTLAEQLWTYTKAVGALFVLLSIGLVVDASDQASNPPRGVEVYQFEWPDGRPATLTIGEST